MNFATVSAKDVTPRIHASQQTASVSSMPGVAVLNLDNELSCELRAWGRTMAIFREQEQNNYLVEDFHDDSTKKNTSSSSGKMQGI
jgi:hypothetical protein